MANTRHFPAAPVSADRKLEQIAAVLNDPVKPSAAMLRIRIRAIYEGISVPSDRKPFVALAKRARIGGERMGYRVFAEQFRPEPTGPVAVRIPGEAKNLYRIMNADLPPEPDPVPVNSPPKTSPRGAAAKAAARTVREIRAIKAQQLTALYRWYDDMECLLYVGIAEHLGGRTKSHVKGSSWMEFAVRSAVERHPTREIALAAERVAIESEQPLFNVQWNDTPEAQRRLVEYLVQRDRLDLLVPAVTRG